MAGTFRNKLTGKSVVIVGGTSGVGYAVAEASVEFGANVVVVSRTQDNVNKTLQRLHLSYPESNSRVRGFVCDISSSTAEVDITKLFEFITNNGSRPVYHVVTTASSLPNITSLSDATAEDMVAFSKYHFIGDTMLAKVAAKYLKGANTSSFTMTGGAGTHKPPPGWNFWASVGGAKDALARGLAVGIAPVRVNLVSLGAIRTELFERAAGNWGEEAIEASKNNSLLGTVGDPRDVAETYLAITKNHFQTGTITFVEGGALLK
ncbi:unnamed protein product [Clonostachys byssicola]|uniref:Uncharacterized protein n=1 Tax=Clonostachys byssicola TaxID=160290 RepID=A0A9N9XV43_9HYPO|nr:unnamed protein product [Clonostachys byssicola]